jgi:hypothetical protein
MFTLHGVLHIIVQAILPSCLRCRIINSSTSSHLLPDVRLTTEVTNELPGDRFETMSFFL